MLATGFHTDTFMRPMVFKGRDSVNLDTLRAEGPEAYMAMTLPDFPNFFMLNGPNGPVGNFSLIDIAEHQWHYIAQLIDKNGIPASWPWSYSHFVHDMNETDWQAFDCVKRQA